MRIRIPVAWLLAAGMMAAMVAGPRPAACETVEPGDVLQIEVYAGGEKQNDFSATVSTDRAITCPLIGSISIGSGDTADIAAKLRDALARDYFVNPQVLVTVKQHGAKIYVLGEVRRVPAERWTHPAGRLRTGGRVHRFRRPPPREDRTRRGRQGQVHQCGSIEGKGRQGRRRATAGRRSAGDPAPSLLKGEGVENRCVA